MSRNKRYNFISNILKHIPGHSQCYVSYLLFFRAFSLKKSPKKVKKKIKDLYLLRFKKPVNTAFGHLNKMDFCKKVNIPQLGSGTILQLPMSYE